MSTTKIKTSQIGLDADLALGGYKITGLATPTISTDAATKAYVDGILGANDAMLYKGVIDCSADPNYPTGNAGDTYKASLAGHIGGASGVVVSIGDMIICTTDGTSTGTQAGVGADWNVIHVGSASGTVISSATSATDNAIVRMDATSGAIVQTSLVTIDDSGSINIPSGQSYKVNGTAIAANANHTGDVTGDGALTIASKAVTLAKMDDLAQSTLIGRATASTGVPEALSASQVRTLLNVADGATNVTLPSFVTREAVSGTMNGTNPTFTLAHAPTADSEMLFLNGLLLNPGAGNDYTISGSTITMLTIPVSTDVFLATYRF